LQHALSAQCHLATWANRGLVVAELDADEEVGVGAYSSSAVAKLEQNDGGCTT